MPKPRFVFNDETKNSYGFIIPTAGISLERFNKNPMMLDSHYNSTWSVIGKWEDIKTEGAVLSGAPDFDSDDENAAKIEGKVDRGYIKACSMGITFNPDDLKYVGGQLILEKCELYEVSIVAVPSNANSIRLYSVETGELIQEEEVQKLCLAAITGTEEVPPIPKTQKSDMKVTLTSAAALALGLSATQTEIESEELSAKITKLEADKKAAELQLSAKLQAEETQKLTGITEKVKLAIKNGLFTADKEQDLINLGIANESLLDSTIAAVPAKASLSTQVKNTVPDEVKTVEDFQKLDLNAQLAFKAAKPEEYHKLFTQN